MNDSAVDTLKTEARHPRSRRIGYSLAGIVLLALVAGSAAGPVMSNVEQPDYKIESSEAAFEIRSYGPVIAAEAVVEGERKNAINKVSG